MLRLSAVFLCVLIAASAFAGFSKTQDFRLPTAEEKALKDVAYAPGAPAVVLDWIEIDDDTNATSAEYYRIKILTDEGKKYADVEIPYFSGWPVNGRVTDISARTIQPDGTIVPFDGKVYDKILLKGAGLRFRAKTFSLPAVQPGSILEYRYQRRWREQMLFNTLWSIQRDIPVLHAFMSIKPYDSNGMYRSFFTYHNLPAGKVPTLSPKKTYDLELTDVPVYQAEEFAPPEESLKTRVNFYYTEENIEPSAFWGNQAGAWIKQTEGFIGRVDASLVKPLMGKDAMETLQNIYAKVQTYKNLSFEDEPTEDDKKNAAAVIAKGEGYRSEINRAFVALARAAGLEAHVVRVATRDRFFFSSNVPDGEQMDGEIAAVTVNGQTHTFDPGTPTAPFGIVSWEKSNVPGLRLVKGARPEFQSFADQKPDHAVARRSADLRLNGDLLEGTITATFIGQEALYRRLKTWGEDEAEQTKSLEDEAKTWFPSGATVKLTEVTGAKSYAEPLVVKLDVTLSGLVSSAGSRTILPISVFASSGKNPFAPATRTHPIYFRYARRIEDQVKIALPETLTLAEVPKPAKVDAGALQYANEVKHDGTTLTYTRSMSVDTMLVEVQYYRSVRNFFSSVLTADQKPLVLVSK